LSSGFKHIAARIMNLHYNLTATLLVFYVELSCVDKFPT